MNQKTPRAAAAFMVVTVVAALLAGAGAIWTAGFPTVELPALVVLSVLGALAHLYPIRSAQTNVATYEVANTFLFAGVILLGGGWLALLPVLVWIPMTVRRYLQRKPDWLLIPAANAGQSLIISVACHWFLRGFTRAGGPVLTDIGVLLGVIAVFVLYQALWVAVVVYLARGVSLFSLDVWKRDSLIGEALVLCLGTILALLWKTHPALLILIMAPVASAYHMLRGVQLIRLGELDGKTGLYNSRRFEEQFQIEVTSAKLLHRPLSLVFFDLDFLRDVNNNYGHLAGDAVIVEVAHRIRNHLRQQDFAARFGGEEFVLLLPGTDLREAQWIAERIRQAVADMPFNLGDGQRIACSISGGVAAFPAHGSSVQQLTAAADAALYHAKRHGRNRICLADEVPPTPAAPDCQPCEPCRPTAPTPAPTAASAPAQAATPAPAAQRAPGRPAAERPALPSHQTEPVQPVAPPPRALARVSAGQPLVLVMAAAALLLPALTGLAADRYALIALLAVLGFCAEFWKMDLLGAQQSSRPTMSLGVAVTMAAAATQGSVAAILVQAANFLAYALQARSRKPATLVANLGIVLLAALVSSLPFLFVRERFAGSGPWFFGAVLVAGGLYFLINAGLVALVVSRRQRVAYAHVWRESFGWTAPTFIFTAACGGLMGSAYIHMGWQAVPVFALPLLILRYTYQAHIRKSEEAYRTAETGRRALAEAHQLKTQSMEHLIESVSSIIDTRDASVSGHSAQVARYAVAIAGELGLHAEEVAAIRQAALLHDLGKLAIPEAILHKPARLTPEEWVVMQTHAEIGERTLQRIPGLERVARMVGEHHEKFGGRGYPRGLAGEEITLGARIIALADALDSMLADRPYSRAKPMSWVLEEIDRCAGEHFDPTVVTAFRRIVAREPLAFFASAASGPEAQPQPLMEVAVSMMKA